MTERARELLERALRDWDSYEEPYFERLTITFEEIRAYLAEPEVKREPLSDEEIVQAYEDACFIGTMTAFVAGVRFAEKYHGIGGEG